MLNFWMKKIPPSPPFAKGGTYPAKPRPLWKTSPFAKGGTRGIFFILLLLLPLFLLAADLREPQPENPKPILDAPSLRIPAAPAYPTTLKELGYVDRDDLLQQTLQAQSGVNSVAFDGGGATGLRFG